MKCGVRKFGSGTSRTRSFVPFRRGACPCLDCLSSSPGSQRCRLTDPFCSSYAPRCSRTSSKAYPAKLPGAGTGPRRLGNGVIASKLSLTCTSFSSPVERCTGGTRSDAYGIWHARRCKRHSIQYTSHILSLVSIAHHPSCIQHRESSSQGHGRGRLLCDKQ